MKRRVRQICVYPWFTTMCAHGSENACKNWSFYLFTNYFSMNFLFGWWCQIFSLIFLLNFFTLLPLNEIKNIARWYHSYVRYELYFEFLFSSMVYIDLRNFHKLGWFQMLHESDDCEVFRRFQRWRLSIIW